MLVHTLNTITPRHSNFGCSSFFTSRSFTLSRVDLESHKRGLSVVVYAYNIRYTDPCANDGPSFAQRNLTITQIHQSLVGGEIPSLAKVNMNKVSIFYGILFIVPVPAHFHYIMRLCGQSRSEE